MDADPWHVSLEAAHLCVQRAHEGDCEAAGRVIDEAIIAITGLMQFDEADPAKLRLNVLNMEDPRRLVFHKPPSPPALVYLRSLLLSLKAIQGGHEPASALNLGKPANRPPDPNLGVRDALLFMQIGEAVDKLKAKGLTRQDRPVETAFRQVAKKNNVTVAVVQKAWSAFGSERGWEEQKG